MAVAASAPLALPPIELASALAPARRHRSGGPCEPIGTTLLELVQAVAEQTHDDREVVATVRHMLRSGRVRLTGNFRDVPVEKFLED